MGEEWAASTPFPYFCDARDEQLDEAVRVGRRQEFAAFGWEPSDIPDPIAPSTFESARLRWAELASAVTGHAEMLSWYRQLLSLRRARAELSDPRPSSTSVDVDEKRSVVIMRRGATVVLANLADESVSLTASGTILAASVEGVVVDGDEVFMPPHSLAVIA
jgi:maltooligosyltrehalose trehalohydrolase